MIIQPTFKINDLEREIVERTIKEVSGTDTVLLSYAFAWCDKLSNISFPNCTSIGSFAFVYCDSLITASFPNCTTIAYSAFFGCSALTTISFPKCVTIANTGAFAYCVQLSEVFLSQCITLGSNAFNRCYNLTVVSLPKCTTIGSSAFSRCYNLISLYLLGSSVATLANITVFSSTPIGGYSASAGQFGSIYVPSSLLASYKTATNWSSFSSRFVGV